ncbi:oligosaccharide flippase family protein [Vibrio vulnificus]|uniref:oligosaccharide flippase family protein n=1 Tax=Vibrio vulnificus TaxID=672 RepID=UPI0007EE77E6|nr:oligosaccharide flippase family protein [Vibrio vulnificus]ANN27786.1 hypothetical protein FORC17_2723 [Vibrio vulnificus]MCU8408564.1 oligosaccharide flippase family protein [Vibrio vulnificus]
MEQGETNKKIFKSTFLFAGVQVINILTKVCINKSAAIFLGSEGVGLIGVLQTLANLIKTLFGLGVPQSSVRDISRANSEENNHNLLITSALTSRLIFFLSGLALLSTVVFSPILSDISFGSDVYSKEIMWVAIAVFFLLIGESYLSILKGTRNLRYLAKATIFGSASGIFISIPLYVFMGLDGVAISLVWTAVISTFIAKFYKEKIGLESVILDFKETISKGSNMISMGLALMYVSFLTLLYDYFIKSYLANTSGMELVGYFTAGATIVTAYLGIVTSAMTTDYYPRISAVHDDNKKLTFEVNSQSKMGLYIILPLIIVLIAFLPLIIRVLYSESFLISVDYIYYAVYGTVIMVCSNAMGMILLAKQAKKIFFFSVTINRLIGVLITIALYSIYGLKGIGISVLLMGIFHLALMQFIMSKFYNISFDMDTIFLLLVVLLLMSVTQFLSGFGNPAYHYFSAFLIFVVSSIYSINGIQKLMGIKVYDVIKKKVRK